MKKIPITIEVSAETYELIKEKTYIIKYLTKNRDEHYTVEDFVKGALAAYLKRRHYEDHDEIRRALQNLEPLSSEWPLKNRIGLLLQQEDISINKASRILGVSKGTLSGIVNNEHQPSLDVFIRLYYLLGCPPLDEILYRDNE